MRPFEPAAALLLLALASLACAQKDIGGTDQYPQFRVLSGLPGGGFGVLPGGRPSIDGAAALATPIGYTLGSHGALGIFNTNDDLNPFAYSSSTQEETSNGTIDAMLGGSLAGFRGSLGFEILSRHLDSAFNLQVSPPLKGRLGLAFGVQDVGGGGGSAGTGFATDGRSSRSFYGVGTYDLGHRAYVSLGAGDRRYRGVFGNASAPIVDGRLRAVVEYDAFNFNAGLIYNPGRFKGLGGEGSRIESNLFVGLVRGRYGTVGLTFTF